MQTAKEEIVINVQELEPRLRHQTIFDTFDGLEEGESLVIHNNHDPQPVYYQLMDIRGNIFSWEYLQQGPEWWDIRVTRTVGKLSDDLNELILNVPAIEPRYKHEAIFQVFNGMNPGETFIIHNDHDPKPLFYQLSNEHGEEALIWEYLLEGPEWWNIRVGKKSTPVSGNNKEGETIINVPSIEPRLKHQTIFNTFNSLKPGESFIIHNDHDPKPVYYQLMDMHGEIFTWEYLHQGPDWWDIRVTKKIIEENKETIGEIVAKDIRKTEIFKKYGIDFCCNGDKTVRQACAENGIDPVKVEAELLKPVQSSTGIGAMNFDEWNLDFLSDYIVNTHHNYIRKNVPEIKAYAIKVAKVHGDRHPELLRIRDLALQLCEELPTHIAEEENDLFPDIKEIVKSKNSNTAYKGSEGKNFSEKIAQSEKEHNSVGDAIKEIDKLSNHYTVPADGCASYQLLFKMLHELEDDLFIHIHLENNILFPKAVEMEKSLLK